MRTVRPTAMRKKHAGWLILCIATLCGWFTLRSVKSLFFPSPPLCSLPPIPNKLPPPSHPTDVPAAKFLSENRFEFPQRGSVHFSSHFCTGGEDEFGQVDWYFRRCVFKNLLFYSGKRPKLVYNKSPNEPLVDFPNNQAVFAKYFPLPLWVRADNVSNPHKPPIGDTYVFAHECDLGYKVGHDFDSVWSTFQALLSLQMLDFDNKLVVVGRTHHHQKEAIPPLSKWWNSLTTNVTRWEAFRQHSRPWSRPKILSRVVFTNRHKTEVTFPSFFDAFVPQLYRQRAMKLLRVLPPTNPVPPSILVRFKTKTHGFTDHSSIVRFLAQAYPRCRVSVLNGTRESSLAEELRAISSADVFLTPGGGGSFSGMFVKPGATVLYGNVCWRGFSPKVKDDVEDFGIELVSRTGRFIHCYRQDNLVWTLFNHYQKRYISANRLENISFPDVDTHHQFQRTLRHSFMPDFEELVSYVDEALIRSGMKEFTARNRGFRKVDVIVERTQEQEFH